MDGVDIGSMSTCDCGVVGELDPRLVSAVVALREKMGEGLTIGRAFVCSKCLHRFEGYADSGHDKGTDIDLIVIGQYYRHKMLRYISDLFPVISLTPRVFHLSVRSDWPQNACLMS